MRITWASSVRFALDFAKAHRASGGVEAFEIGFLDRGILGHATA